MKSPISAIVVCIIAFFQCNCAQSAETAAEDGWSNWRINLSTTVIDHYLDYPTSSIHKLLKVSCSYAQPTKRPATRFENFYYSESRILGMRRETDLNITSGTSGVIKVINSTGNDSFAIANAIVRIYLEASLNRCMINFVEVPVGSFDRIVDALCTQGFHLQGARSDEGSQGWMLTLEVVSNEESKQKRLVMP